MNFIQAPGHNAVVFHQHSPKTSFRYSRQKKAVFCCYGRDKCKACWKSMQIFGTPQCADSHCTGSSNLLFIWRRWYMVSSVNRTFGQLEKGTFQVKGLLSCILYHATVGRCGNFEKKNWKTKNDLSVMLHSLTNLQTVGFLREEGGYEVASLKKIRGFLFVHLSGYVIWLDCVTWHCGKSLSSLYSTNTTHKRQRPVLKTFRVVSIAFLRTSFLALYIYIYEIFIRMLYIYIRNIYKNLFETSLEPVSLNSCPDISSWAQLKPVLIRL